jgi:hypothetical protein
VFTSITSLQTIKGFWKDAGKLGKLLGVPKIAAFPQLQNVEDENSIFASVLALAILRKTFSSNRASWSLIEEKCLNWLASQNVDSEALISHAMELVPAN